MTEEIQSATRAGQQWSMPTAAAVATTPSLSAAAAPRPPVRLCIIVTVPLTLNFLLRPQFRYLADHGFHITAVCAPGPEVAQLAGEPIRIVTIPMEREPSPLRDAVSLARLWVFLLTHRFDVVQVSTPKASLLGSLAARLSGHRRLVYSVLGRAYENTSGNWRRLLAGLDGLACRLATRVNAVAFELAEQMVREGLCPRQKIGVLGSGSTNGIDVGKFTRSPELEAKAAAIRTRFGVAGDAALILFIGRLRREKGINELVRAFAGLAEEHPHAQLLLVGRYENVDPIEPEVQRVIAEHPRIHHLEWQSEPAAAHAAADILALPTYREGFPTVTLEAGCLGVPVVATDIMGCRESVQHDVTGLLVPPQDVPALREALDRLIRDPALRRRLGDAGRERVEREFRQERVWQAMVNQYDELLGGRQSVPRSRRPGPQAE